VTVVMASEVKGEMAVAQFRSPVEARADIAGSPREEKMRPAGSSKRDTDAITPPNNPTLVSAEQYLCYLSGFICMGCGGWGNLYEVQPRPFFQLYLMAGISIRTDITAYRSCMPCFWISTRSMWTGKTGRVIGFRAVPSIAVVGRNRVCNGKLVSIRRTVVGSWRKWKGRT
jgi:hypothetical protein